MQISWAQTFPASFYKNTSIDSTLHNSINFSVENTNFLKNDEYFNRIVEGYTLLGWMLDPKITYFPTKNAKIEAGIHFLKYSGVNGFTQAIPTLSFQYRINKSIDVILGSLYGNTNHKLIEPIFRYEYYFTDNVENGLQFLINSNRFSSDIWLNWQQFIFKGDDKQEIFNAGFSNKVYLSDKNNRHQFSIPIQILFTHQGGQINKTDEKLITHNNDAIGLSYSCSISNQFINSFGANQYYLIFKDLSHSYQFPYSLGYGLFSNVFVTTGQLKAQVSWWYGDHYISLRGNPFYQSKSTIYDRYYEKQRAFVSTRVMYEKEITKGLNIGGGTEMFINLYNYDVDYWYSFYINFNRSFFLKRIKNNYYDKF